MTAINLFIILVTVMISLMICVFLIQETLVVPIIRKRQHILLRCRCNRNRQHSLLMRRCNSRRQHSILRCRCNRRRQRSLLKFRCNRKIWHNLLIRCYNSYKQHSSLKSHSNSLTTRSSLLIYLYLTGFVVLPMLSLKSIYTLCHLCSLDRINLSSFFSCLWYYLSWNIFFSFAATICLHQVLSIPSLH